MGTILEATKESIIDRVDVIDQPDSSLPSSVPLAKRTRSNTAAASKSPSKKRVKSKPQLHVESKASFQQTTLSQFATMEPTVRHLESLNREKRKKKIPARFVN
ncbi:MAG: hypothetical protein M1829_006162 [Trizodia sp. TS-e1964]|nr:MAG: hypothetical protein M1829_006162 [Trizodia sp. TS-e1964]